MDPVSEEKPIQHGYTCAQFKCKCGKVITFSENSLSYPVLKNLTTPGPRMRAGNCPFCNRRHWYGITRYEKAGK